MAAGTSRCSPTRGTTRPTRTPCTSARTTPTHAKRYPIVVAPNSKRDSTKSANIDSNDAKAVITRNDTASTSASFGRDHARWKAATRPGRARAPRFSGGSDSGRKNSAALKFASERVAAKNAGAE